MVFLVAIVNVLVYGLMCAATGEFTWPADTLMKWGGNVGAYSLHGEWWRLLTSNYLHAGPQHILGNMVLLLMAGSVVELRIGPILFVLVYTFCGTAAAAASGLANPIAVAVGASGAIAGIVGVMLVLFLSGKHPGISGKWMAQTIAINALYSLAPDVDWVAHLGGFVTGLACGGLLLLRPTPDPRPG